MNAAEIWTPLLLSLKVAAFATLVTAVGGVALSYALARSRFALLELADAFVCLPLVLPPTVLGYYLLVAFGRHGWLGRWLRELFGVSLIFTWQGAVVACAVVSLPLVVKSARAAFEEINPKLEIVARTLGMGPWRVFLKVSLPLAWRGILAGCVLAFARSLGEFGATLMVAGSLPGKTQTLSLAVYDAVQAGNETLAAVLVVVVSIVSACVMLASRWLLRPHGLPGAGTRRAP
jgi:molybdate transport system permease protein